MSKYNLFIIIIVLSFIQYHSKPYKKILTKITKRANHLRHIDENEEEDENDNNNNDQEKPENDEENDKEKKSRERKRNRKRKRLR